MARGGKREGAGRKPGSRNKKTERTNEAKAAAAAAIESAIPGAFEGDAHDLLMAVYKDPRHDVRARIDCAKAALPFEKQRLSITKHVGDRDEPIVIERIERTIVDPQHSDG